MAKSRRIDRRILAVTVAFGLALGTSVLALAQPELPELPEEASDQASEAVTSAPARADDEEPSEVEDSAELEVEAEAETGTAFSEWVRSVPKWGCIRGLLVSQMAATDHAGDFEGPTYGSPEEAAVDLEILDRNCAQVAIRKAADAEVDGTGGNGNAFGHDKKPDHARGRPDGVPPGPPEHAGGDEESSEGE